MSKRSAVFLSSLLIISSVLLGAQVGRNPWSRSAKNPERKFADGEVLVKFRSGQLSSAAKLHANLGVLSIRSLRAVEGLQLVRLPAGTSVRSALHAYRSNPDVQYAEPNYIVSADGVPNDPLYPRQWPLSNPGGPHAVQGADVDAEKAWSVTTGSSNVVVAVIDSGVDYLHPDLASNIFTNTADCNNDGIDDDGDGYVDDCHGINVITHTSDPMDDFGHGTHVSGIIGAIGNNGIGVSGLNWNVRILPCKFLDQNGQGTIAGAIECLSYVKRLKDSGVNIVATNNSWGGFDISAALIDAIAAQRDDGILFVAAAGNNFSSNDYAPQYPASIAYSNVISVASSTMLDTFSDFSNFGRHSVHLAAPGSDVLSTLPSSAYGFASGTSMAAPLVTGTVALLKAQDPSRDWKQLKNLVLAGGDIVPQLSETITGRRLNAFGSLTCNSSPVYSRILPQDVPVAVTVGTPVKITYEDINCASPVGQLHGSVVETGELITFKDDGTSPDEVANDGTWTASWAPPAIGAYNINVQGGDSLKIEALTPYVLLAKTSDYRAISGTSLDLGDDEVAALTAPFPLSFGNVQFDKLYISSNGTVSLSNSFKEFYNRSIPLTPSSNYWWDALWNAYQTTTLIAPWWDDLYPIKGTQQNVFWAVTGAAPTRELVIEWRNVRFFDCHGDPDTIVTFEAVFKEGSSDVDFEYLKTGGNCTSQDHGASATVGLQTSGAQGAQWLFDQAFIEDGTSLTFLLNTESLPTNPVPAITALVPNNTAVGGSADLTLVVQGSNFVPGSQVLWGGGRVATAYVSSKELHATINWFNLSVATLVQISVLNPAPGGGVSNELPFGVGGEPPVITSLTPSSVHAGSGAFDLTIRGRGFTQGQGYISFGSVWRQMTSVTPTEIHATITASDVAQTGTYKVQVRGFAGFPSNQADFVVTSGIPAQSFNDGKSPSSSPAAPLTRSVMKFMGWSSPMMTKPEYAKWFSRPRVQSSPIASATPPGPLAGSLALAPGTPVPGIRLNPTVPAGFMPTGIVAADFNHDGNIDWAVSNGGDNNVYVYLGRGDGTCDPATIVPLRGVSPVAMVGADLRKNGDMDLVLAEIDTGTVGVLLSKGDGTFEPELLHYVNGPIYSVGVGDFDGNGIPDIAYGIDNFYASPYTIEVDYFPGLGNGNFDPPRLGLPTTEFASVAYSLTVADLKNRGVPDIISPQIYETRVYENNNGVLKRGQTLAWEYTAAVGDLDEDGCADVVTLNEYGYASVAFGHCDGTFEVRDKLTGWGLGEIGFGVRIADVNRDGHMDVIAGGILVYNGGGYGSANGGLVSVMLGDGKGHFDYPRVYPAEQGIYDLQVIDINHDGWPDILTANQDSDSVSILLNDGKGGFGKSSGQYTGNIRDGSGGGVNDPIGSPLVFDINNDGKPDILLLTDGAYADSPSPLVALLNEGEGKFGDPIKTPLIAGHPYPWDYAVADFRNSGKQDVLISFANGQAPCAFAINRGDGTFTVGTSIPACSMGHFATGDFDRDGTVDAVLVGTPNITFLHSNGDGTFAAKAAGSLPSTGVAAYVGSVASADLNGDGRLDLIVHATNNAVPYNDHAVVELLGNGDGTFQLGTIVIPNAGRVSFADLNHDGHIDVINATDAWSSTLLYEQAPPEYHLYFGQLDGTFPLSANYDQYKFSIGNLFGDSLASGKADSAFADYSGNHVGDIAALQDTVAFPRRLFLQFMKGVGNGDFVPNFATYSFGNYGNAGPLWAADFDGDGTADMLEYDGFTSSFHILQGVDGKKLDAMLLVNPVKGSLGTVRVFLSNASTSDTVVSLRASDSNILVPASVTIPAGLVYADVPFTIGPGFNINRQFKITAGVGADHSDAYGTQVLPNSPVTFTVTTYTGSVAGVPGAETYSQMTFVHSMAGYSGHIKMSCANLPPGATCVFSSEEFDIQKGGSATIDTAVNLPPGIAPGDYSFQIQASDSVGTASTPVTLTVSDFAIASAKPYVEVLAGGSGFTTLGVSFNGPANSVALSCAVGSQAATCEIVREVAEMRLNIHAANVQLGTYPIVVTGVAGNLSHTLNMVLRVVDVSATFSMTTINLKPNTSGTITLHITASDTLQDTGSVTCSSSQTMSCYGSIVQFSAGTKSVDTVLNFNVPSSYPFAARPTLLSHLKRSWKNSVLIALSTLPLAILLMGSPKKRKMLPAAVMVLVFLFLASAISCGGGGTSGGGGGGDNGGGGGNPPPQVKSEVFTITYTTLNFSKPLGTVTVNVASR